MANIIYVSKAGLDMLKARLEELSEELRILRSEKAIAYTATGDTWHDNPYFNRLEQDEKRKAQEVAEFHGLVAIAQVFSCDKRNTTRVQIGSIVFLNRYYKVSGEEEQLVWEIVGYGETDVPQKRVAYNAPMAQALMGLHIGETGVSDGPKGSVEYEVIGLFSGWDDVPEKFKIG